MAIQNGNRKMKVFYWTEVLIAVLIGSALISGVEFTGDHVVNMIFAVGGVGLSFMGGNAAEHWSKARAVNGKNTEG